MTEPSAAVEAYAVRYGTLRMDRSAFFDDFAAMGQPDGPIEMDYYFWVLRTPDGVVLVDCGFDPDAARRRGRTPEVDVLDGLGELGLAPIDVRVIIVTHFHYDHVGNLGRFPGATLVAQRAESAFWSAANPRPTWLESATEPDELARLEAESSSGRLLLVDGTAEIVPGVRVEQVGGHTPGQQIVHVDSASGPLVLASDALHLDEELESGHAFSLSVDLPATYRAFARLRELEAEGARVVAGHDPSVARGRDASGRTAPEVVTRLG